LKKQLVKEFEEHDLRTYRLCFAIKMQPKTGLLGSIVIKKQRSGSFDILHTKDFNPNSKDFITFKQEVVADELGEQLIELCNNFYGLLINNNPSLAAEVIETEDNVSKQAETIYQCKNCLSIYDKAYGDAFNGIAINTDFELLSDYSCPVCDSPKKDFLMIEKKVSLY
jgi:rubredoxin